MFKYMHTLFVFYVLIILLYIILNDNIILDTYLIVYKKYSLCYILHDKPDELIYYMYIEVYCTKEFIFTD